jgi:hypothetical protein
MDPCSGAANSNIPVDLRAFQLATRVVIPIYALTHYYALVTMLRRKTGV